MVAGIVEPIKDVPSLPKDFVIGLLMSMSCSWISSGVGGADAAPPGAESLLCSDGGDWVVCSSPLICKVIEQVINHLLTIPGLAIA